MDPTTNAPGAWYFQALPEIKVTKPGETPPPSINAMDATIPVLDMNDWARPETQDRFTQTLKDACQNVGFFAVVNTNIDPEILDGAYAVAEKFFHQDPQDKMEIHVPGANGQRGYVQSESAKGTAFKDCKEFIHIGPPMNEEQEARLQFGKNVWPTGIDLETPMMELYSELREYAIPLQQALSSAIGEEPGFLHEMTEEGDVLMRVLHYPENAPTGVPWASAHTDINLFTILPRSTADGLQVQSPDGTWIDVKVPDGSIIVNVGDILQNMTNGLFCSSVHQVQDPGDGQERFSIVMFIHPRSEDEMSPRPKMIEQTDGVAKYPTATRIELLAERLADLDLADDGLLQLLSNSNLCERNIALGKASRDAMERLEIAGYASDEVKAELSRLRRGM
ncbi:Uncharacterized protein SCG7086_AC_00410 [Chlamydiales bacterium SCGC AG-110-P3]|nr:Uncharacterized protein SCG7086_AC_00410 [Chlamydiales bacterium SCGC AG-110-P3]